MERVGDEIRVARGSHFSNISGWLQLAWVVAHALGVVVLQALIISAGFEFGM